MSSSGLSTTLSSNNPPSKLKLPMQKLAKIGMATEIESEGKASNVSITVAEEGKENTCTHA